MHKRDIIIIALLILLLGSFINRYFYIKENEKLSFENQILMKKNHWLKRNNQKELK